MPGTLYIFIDESGDFNFSKNGTAFYIFTAVMTFDPVDNVEMIMASHLAMISGRLLPKLDSEYIDDHLSVCFHACEDKQPVRNVFFNLIQGMKSIQVNAVVVTKNKTNPSLREDKVFYSRFLGSLLSYVFQSYKYSELCILINGCAVEKNKKIFKKTVATEIRKRDPKTNYRIYFPSSASFYHLQIADYITWAIRRKWELGDTRSYDLIKHLLQKPEKDIFSNGNTVYY